MGWEEEAWHRVSETKQVRTASMEEWFGTVCWSPGRMRKGFTYRSGLARGIKTDTDKGKAMFMGNFT